jgi:hypothetical protein
MLLYQAVQAANATKHLLAMGNSETLLLPAPPPSAPEATGAAPVVKLSSALNSIPKLCWLCKSGELYGVDILAHN